MSTNRVVVTGYGVTSPIGNTPEEFWNSLHDGKIGIKPITKFDASEIPVFNAGEIQDFPFDKYFVKKILTVWTLIHFMRFMLLWKHLKIQDLIWKK